MPLVALLRKRTGAQVVRAARQIAQRRHGFLRNGLRQCQAELRSGRRLQLKHYALVRILSIGILARGVGADRERALAFALEAMAALLVERHRLQAGKEAREAALRQADLHGPVADAIERQRAPRAPTPFEAHLDPILEGNSFI